MVPSVPGKRMNYCGARERRVLHMALWAAPLADLDSEVTSVLLQ